MTKMPPMKREHEAQLRAAVEALVPITKAVVPGDEEVVDEAADFVLAYLQKHGVPSWYAAPVLALAATKLFEFNLKRSAELREKGEGNPADPV